MNKKLDKILTELKEKGNFSDVLYAHTEGETISEILSSSFDHESMVAMCASALKSAKNLGKKIEDRKPKKLVAELDSKTIFIISCLETSFLILIIENDSDFVPIFDDLDVYIQKIKELS